MKSKNKTRALIYFFSFFFHFALDNSKTVMTIIQEYYEENMNKSVKCFVTKISIFQSKVSEIKLETSQFLY